MRASEPVRIPDVAEASTFPVPAANLAEGFVIEEVEMQGFMRYLERAPPVRFPESFTVITGKTGSGKTSILDAITFALYKRTTRTDPPANAKITDLCKPGGHVRVAFRQRGRRFDVRRGFASNGNPFLDVSEEGSTISGTIPEKEKAIQDIVGLDYEGFLNSTFVRQEEMKALGSTSGSQRLAVFQKLFRLETFEKAAAKASERLAAVELEASVKEQEIITRKERIDRLPELRGELAALEDGLKDLGRREAELAAKLKGTQEALKGLETRHDEYTRAGTAAKERMMRLERIAAKVGQLEREGVKARELRERIGGLEGETGGYDAIAEEGDRLVELQQAHTIVTQQREGLTKRWEGLQDAHERRLRQLSDSLFKEEARVAKLSTDIAAEEAFTLLRTEGALGERLARIEKELAWLKGKRDLLAALKEEQQEARAELDRVSQRTSRINVDSFVLAEIGQHIADIKRQMKEEDDAHDARQREMKDEYSVLDQKIVELGFTDDSKKRLAELRARRGGIEAKRKELDRLRKELEALGDPTARIRELGEERATLVADLESLKTSLEALAKDEEAYAAAKASSDALKREMDQLRESLFSKKGEGKRLASQIAETERDAAKSEDAQKALADLVAEREVLSILKNEVFHKKGVVMYAVNQLLPALEIESSRNLHELTDGRFSQVKLETYEEARGHGIRILVRGVDAQWHDVGEFSGGEKTQINAALRFAIAKELASMPQVGRAYGRMKTLFIDEGDLGSLDTEVSRELFMHKLFGMGAFFDKVILITHLTEIADRFPSRIRVEMTSDQVSRAEALS